MADIKDFLCTYANSSGINSEVTDGLDLVFPEAYEKAESMAILSLALKKHDGASVCELPFCHTVEGEALGGLVTLGDANIGPRARGYCCETMEDVLALKPIDFSKGRIHEVLVACQMLREQGEQVVLEISGPFTILNVLLDAPKVFKALRKQPDVAFEAIRRLGNEILEFMKEAKKYGVQLISYADSSGALGIVGPKVSESVVENFTYEFMKKVEEEICDENTIVLMCPKTSFALIGCEKASFEPVKLSGPMRYSDACIELIGKVNFAGQNCIKNVDYRLENGIMQTVVLR